MKSPIRKIGFRGLALLAAGGMWIFIGISVFQQPTELSELWYTRLPLWARGTMWLGAGLFAVVVAFIVKLQNAGFVALYLAPLTLVVSFAGAVLFHYDGRWLRGFAIYLFFLLFVMLVARWPEPPEPPELTTELTTKLTGGDDK